MIIIHAVQGSPYTSLHDFEISTEDNNLIVSGGTYTRNMSEVYTNEGNTFTIPSLGETVNYEIWVTKNEIILITDSSQLSDPVDRLAWFQVPPNTQTLDEVNIQFMKTI
ncbi:hypothetical protein AB3Z07_21150 [Metabacillus halosaccharovorans]|uniref:hypothetical protein n=1 Tax=Metabacillus halosaccharovorans TaxID=930124 RepID=UPI0034CDA09A